ncbi:MAG: hypothetical protein ACJ8AI_30060, partial [Rhodopila sp.]
SHQHHDLAPQTSRTSNIVINKLAVAAGPSTRATHTLDRSGRDPQCPILLQQPALMFAVKG